MCSTGQNLLVYPIPDTKNESTDCENYFDNVMEEVSNKFRIKHMRCVVNTLKLVMKDGLKDNRMPSLTSKLRQVAGTGRVPKIDAILNRRPKKGIIINQVTRWRSTYLIVKRLFEFFLEDLDNKMFH